MLVAGANLRLLSCNRGASICGISLTSGPVWPVMVTWTGYSARWAAGFTKNFSDLDLNGQGATGRMSGFYFTDGNPTLDHDTQQNHLGPAHYQ